MGYQVGDTDPQFPFPTRPTVARGSTTVDHGERYKGVAKESQRELNSRDWTFEQHVSQELLRIG